MTNHDQHEKTLHHVVPFPVYYRIFGALITLTVVTVLTSYIDFGGSTNIVIAMAIASVKALLVVLFFMGLRYDGQENNVVFFCSFVFLSIFVGLTSSDLFYRFDTQPVKVDASELPPTGGPVDVKKLAAASPDLQKKGQSVFSQQCISCHGANGQGDGPAAAALNPKPRNFTSAEGWKNGRTVSGIMKTLANGLPPSAMPSFASLSVEDRFALAHYVRSLGPAAPTDTPSELAALEKEVGAGAKPHLTIQRAMDKMVEEYEATHRR
jgi:caa(3)-type oxidase subunit IV